MKTSFIKSQGALRKFIAWQRKFATALYKMYYSAKRIKPVFPYEGSYRTDLLLYKTKYGDKFWLDNHSFVDKCIKDFSIWEPLSAPIVKRFVKPGDVVLDIGANTGYYSVVMSKIVGETGKVLAFEPTQHFGEVLKNNIKANECNNVVLYEYGLSNEELDAEICIGANSATIHWLSLQGTPNGKEKISLKSLDSVIDSLQIDKIDFIKVDIDGHEPAFLNGAWKTILKYKPKILLEVAHAHYYKAGYTAWDLYNELKDRHFHIYSEKSMLEYPDVNAFLHECGNFDFGVNVLISPEVL